MQTLKCLICGTEYVSDNVDYVCPKHGYEGILDVQVDYGQVKQVLSREALHRNPDPRIWRYLPLLPVSREAHLILDALWVGGTPLYGASRIAQEVGVRRVWVKDDGRLPTGSLKDRASAIAILKAQEKKAEVITTASTGNAAAALSGLCAVVGQRNVIFVPRSAPEAKIVQLLVFGSQVVLVEGTYDEAFELCLAASEKYGWYNRNTGYNPYMSEGKKTVAYEICEQLHWQVPDVILVSVGDGCIIGGVHKGLKDLVALGWIEKMPRLIGVQAERSNFLAEAWQKEEDVLTKQPIQAHTVADSISAGLPRDRLKAMRAVTESEGAFITVTDEAILTAIPRLAQGCGVFAEPAGAAPYAGLIQAVEQGLIQSDESCVLLVTGNGLKDIPHAKEAVDNMKGQIFTSVDELVG